jgi:hypothetical protein
MCVAGNPELHIGFAVSSTNLSLSGLTEERFVSSASTDIRLCEDRFFETMIFDDDSMLNAIFYLSLHVNCSHILIDLC